MVPIDGDAPSTEPLARRAAGKCSGLEPRLPSETAGKYGDTPHDPVAYPNRARKASSKYPAEARNGTNDATALEEFRECARTRLSSVAAGSPPHPEGMNDQAPTHRDWIRFRLSRVDRPILRFLDDSCDRFIHRPGGRTPKRVGRRVAGAGDATSRPRAAGNPRTNLARRIDRWRTSPG